METDRELREQVLTVLEWEPGVNARYIDVLADDRVVTLLGHVATYYQKLAAGGAARRVKGVRAVANDIAVKPTTWTSRTDAEIASLVGNVLRWNSAVPPDAVTASVDDGWVTLTGTVAWQHQRMAAEAALRDLYGVKGVNNSIRVRSTASAGNVKTQIEAAFKRSWAIDARNVHVEEHGGAVILTGNVESLFERDEAERAAWSAPGVTNVEDRLQVCT